MGLKSISLLSEYLMAYCKPSPSIMSNSTDGIFVFLETDMNRKEIMIIADTSIMRLYDEKTSIILIF